MLSPQCGHLSHEDEESQAELVLVPRCYGSGTRDLCGVVSPLRDRPSGGDQRSDTVEDRVSIVLVAEDDIFSRTY